MRENKQPCPACGEDAGVPIVYGMATAEMFDDPEIAIGGCVVYGDCPDRRCRACGHEWRGSPASAELPAGP